MMVVMMNQLARSEGVEGPFLQREHSLVSTFSCNHVAPVRAWCEVQAPNNEPRGPLVGRVRTQRLLSKIQCSPELLVSFANFPQPYRGSLVQLHCHVLYLRLLGEARCRLLFTTQIPIPYMDHKFQIGCDPPGKDPNNPNRP